LRQDGSILIDLTVNVVADIIAAFIVGIAALAVLALYRRRGIRKFFGVAGSGSSMKVYLSTIAVNKAGTTGTAQIKEGFYGDAMTELEYRHALRFASVMRSGSVSWVLTTVLGTRAGADLILSAIEKSPSFRQNVRAGKDCEVDYDASVISACLRENTCTVLIGGPIYNLLTHHVLRRRPVSAQWNRFFEFIRENNADGEAIRGIMTVGGLESERFIRSEDDQTITDYFIVSRLTLEKGKRLFVCAGTCTAATAAAVDQLVNWRQYKSYQDKDFGVLYRQRRGARVRSGRGHRDRAGPRLRRRSVLMDVGQIPGTY
jgi:hypothetical protein